VSSHVVGLWIDLVRQAGSFAPKAPSSAANGLTRQHFRALGCLQDEGLTVTALARSLDWSRVVAAEIADRLASVGAVVNSGDGPDRQLERLAVTGAGLKMAADHRSDVVATLEHLLSQVEPARRAVLTLAMAELAGMVGSTPSFSGGQVLAAAAQRWTSR
jgi:DNA-binding MarR family transcriptional regulator